MSYCDIASDPIHAYYHDNEYGFPVEDDNGLFERLMLEVNQAGLSWRTVLLKRENFRSAFDQWQIDRVAEYGPDETARLLQDAGIIRNRLKVAAAIENAKRLQAIRASHGSFKNWLDANHPKTLEQWKPLFKKTFVFTGGEIVNEFLVSTGYLPGSHDKTCPAYARSLAANPAWANAG